MASLEELAERAFTLPDQSRTAGGRGIEFLADKAFEETPDELIAGFTDEGQLGPPGLENIEARIRINTAESAKERIAAFQKVFPEGELRQIPGTGDLIFREDRTQAFAKVDAGLMEKFEPLGDIADVVSGPLLGDIAATLGTRGMNLLPMLGRLFTGAAAGKVAEEGLETAAGTQELTPRGIARDFGEGPVVEGAVAAGGGLALSPIDKLGIDPLRGGGVVPMRPEATETIAAFERQGLESPTAGQITSSPGVRLLEKQSSAISGVIPDLVARQETGMVQALERARNSGDRDRFLAALERVDKVERGRLLKGLRRGSRSAREGGEALQKGLAEWNKAAKARVTTAYRVAEEIEEPVFNAVPLKNKAARLRLEMEELGEPIDKELDEVLTRISEMEDIPTRGTILSGDEQVEITAGDKIRSLRSALFDLKTPPLGDTLAGRATGRQLQARATELFAAADEVLFNPVNNNPGFTAAWREAGGLARERFQTLEKAAVIKALKTETPAQMAQTLARPGQIDNLLELRRVVPTAQWGQFREAFKTDLLSRPGEIAQRLDAFDSESLALLLNPADRAAFRSYGQGIKLWEQAPIKAIRENQSSAGQAIERVISGVGPEAGERFAAAVRRGSTGDKRAARAAVMDWLWKESIAESKGRTFVDPIKFKRNRQILESRGLSSLVNKGDRQLLHDMQLISDTIGSTADPGTSLVAASTVRELSSMAGVVPGGEPLKVRPIIDFLQLQTIGRILASRKARKWLVGLGKTPKPSRLASAFGGISATIAAENRHDSQADANR